MMSRGKSMETIDKEMRVDIKIPHDEVSRLTVNSLISLREYLLSKGKDISAFDVVLGSYLCPEEFEKYVIDKEPIEY